MKESDICNIFNNNFDSWKEFKLIKDLSNIDNPYVSFNTKKRYVLPLVRVNNKVIRLGEIKGNF